MNELIQWLFNFGYDHDISIDTTKQLNPDTPSLADVKDGHVIINMNWSNQSEIPFIFAHEIGHVLCGHVTYSPKNEIEANKTAIGILIKYCWENNINISNPIRFCEEFGIPLRLNYLIRGVIKIE